MATPLLMLKDPLAELAPVVATTLPDESVVLWPLLVLISPPKELLAVPT